MVQLFHYCTDAKDNPVASYKPDPRPEVCQKHFLLHTFLVAFPLILVVRSKGAKIQNEMACWARLTLWVTAARVCGSVSTTHREEGGRIVRRSTSHTRTRVLLTSPTVHNGLCLTGHKELHSALALRARVDSPLPNGLHLATFCWPRRAQGPCRGRDPSAS